jgi:hypothetical protein
VQEVRLDSSLCFPNQDTQSPARNKKEADMHTPSLISTAGLLGFLLVGFSGAQETVSPATAAAGVSKVRIVRLSEVKGQVQLDRLTGKGYEPAMANMPVIEGAKLKTENGIAEVEFEDNSTLRIAPDSTVEFAQLELMPGGVKTSTVNVQQGMVYASTVKDKNNQLTLKFGQQTASLPPDSHVRVQVTSSEANLAVMHGDVAVEDTAGSTAVSKNRTATFALTGQTQPVVAKSLTDQPLDAWDSQSAQYHKNFANANNYGSSGLMYGVSDMNYYGSFVNGCGGSFWRPYFASAAWDPYGSGAWAYYSGAGYSWVSPYPWGWTPYHTGAWSFCQGIGWGWAPGGPWLGLANYNAVNPANGAFKHSFADNRPQPPVFGTTGRSTLVPVNSKALQASSLQGQDKFVFRNDSAGFGVPRGTLGKLGGFSNHVSQHGSASAGVYYPGNVSQSGAGQHQTGFSPANPNHVNSLSTGSHAQGPAGGMHSSMSPGMSGGGGGGGMHTSMSAPSGGGGGGHR